MCRRTLLLWLGWLALVAGRASAAERQNIVFIMSDDHAAHAIGAYGSRVNETPNIDRIAREGAILTRVFATNAICTPGRATILTGQYSHINGVTMFNRFDSSRPTVARLLQAAGYHTGMIGKWHLGSDPVGFDAWEILPGQGAYFDPVLYTASGEKTYTGRYVTDVITDLGIEFIRTRPRGRPFFLMLHHKAPHRPWEPAPDQAARFRNRWIPEPETLWDSYETRSDALRENRKRIAADLTPRDLKERSGFLPGRPRPLRQAVHVRGVAADAVPGPLACGHQTRDPQRRDRSQR
jgi:arylsulfatase A-like enzyme